MTSFIVHAIDPDDLELVRTKGTDAGGNPVEAVVAGGGEPLRCCLRSATPGEALLLFGWEPPLPPSPYREVGAVFAHTAPCEGPAGVGYPADWRGRPQVLRAYDRRGWIHEATTVDDGSEPEAALSALLEDPTVAEVHSRNIDYGCWMFRVTRASG
jgi:hypothetical protein